MGVSLKIAILTFFGVTIFLIAQKAMDAPLAYFVFLPIAFVTFFYFFDSHDWLYAAFSLVLIVLAYFYSGVGPLIPETGAFIAAAAGCFGLLLYHRRMWQGMVSHEEDRCVRIKEELADLKHKHATRVESLLHLEKQVASLINLFETARDFNECLDFKETAQIIFKKVLPELSFERADLLILTRAKTPVTISKVFTITRMGTEERSPIAPDAIENQWLARAQKEKQFVSLGKIWLFPLIVEGEFNGLLGVQGSEKQDLAKFEVLTSQLALQLRKVSLYEMVRELSIIDGLTGAFVRRHFLERFEEEIRRAIKHGFPLSVLMLDIDHFKRYNDDFGHLVGDATLKEVAHLIRTSVRNVDIVARYGGEEFAVIIPETKEDGAFEVAERIRSAVARHSFRVYDEETKVTVSIGVSVYPQDLSKPTQSVYDPAYLFELLQKADRALYRAKEEGRNRVMLYRSLGQR